MSAENLRHDIGHEAVSVLDLGVVEPRAVAGLPLAAAEDAEFGRADARHVVAAFGLLNHAGAVGTATPAFLDGHGGEGFRGFVFWTLGAFVPFAAAGDADFGFAFAAGGLLPACFGVNLGRLDPGTTSGNRTVYSVFCGVFLVFLIPCHLELGVEEVVDVLEGDVVGSTASRWHMCFIFDRHGENTPETGVAHAVATFQLRTACD